MNLHRRLKKACCFRALASVVAGISGFGLLFLFMACESLASAKFLCVCIGTLIIFFGSVLLMEVMKAEEIKLSRAIRKQHERRLAVLYKNNYTGRRIA